MISNICIVAALSFMFWGGWLPPARRRCLSGTYRRYVWNTLERGFRYPAAIYSVNCLLILSQLPRPSGGVVAVFMVGEAVCAITYVLTWRMIRADDRADDDDWFTKSGHRLRSWLRRLRVGPMAAST